MQPNRRSVRGRGVGRASLALAFLTAASWACAEQVEPVLERRVSVEEAFPLDFDGTPESPRGSPIVAMRDDGSLFAVAATSSPSAILLFDGAGSYMRAIGSRGPGPGELGRVRALAFDPADTLWVFGSGRVDVWDPSFELVRSFQLSVPVLRAAPLSPGRMLVAGMRQNISEGQFPAHIVEGTGDVTPLGAGTVRSVFGDLGSTYRSIFPVDDERYWIAGFHEFDVRLMTESGDTVARIAEAPDSWSAAPMSDEFKAFLDASPSILDLAEDGEGLLWVAGGVPLEDREALRMVQAGEAGPEIATRFVDHLVYVYESPDYQRVAEAKFDYRPLRFLGPELAYSTVPAGDSMRIEIVRYDLVAAEDAMR